MAFFQTRRLYRPLMAGGLIAALLAPMPLAAQLRTSKPKKGPRAIAVVRWEPDEKGRAIPRLLPVALLEEGRYYDAGLYRANPRPMALEPGVVYEAQDKGDVLGFFTVQTAARNDSSRQWYGLGVWENARGTRALELRERPQSAEIVKEKKAETSPIFTASGDDRDPKKQTTVYDEEGREIPADQVPPDELPSMKRKQGDIERLPQVAKPPKEPAKPEITQPDDDPDRPKIRRGAAAAETPVPAKTAEAPAKEVSGAPATKSVDDDPNRPIIRRGGGGQQRRGTSEAEESATAPIPGRVQARGDAQTSARTESGFARRAFEAVAVSDAEDPQTRHTFEFRATEEEREQLATAMRKLAEAELTRLMPKAPMAARTTGKAVAAQVAFTEERMAALDLDLNNSAELVYTGRTAVAGGRVLYVTVAARTDVNGIPRKLFGAATASDRLDAAPRLEFIDAVDADGDGRAELLFRRRGESAAEFVLYRVGADALVELFRGGNAE